MTSLYDVIIIGAGPSGLTAGIYCARSGLGTLLLEKGAVGGQILKVALIENYPGFPNGISGFDLVEKMKAQAQRFGIEIIFGEAVEVRPHVTRHKLEYLPEKSILRKLLLLQLVQILKN